MKHTFYKTQKDIASWLDSMSINNYTLISDAQYGFVVDVKNDVNLYNKNLVSIPVKFNRVGGSFNCNKNNLTHLIGSPFYVGLVFSCAGNPLQSLEGGPSEVGDDYACWSCNLTTLHGAPNKINGSFFCNTNKLTNLVGSPQNIKNDFSVNNNNLLSLEGCPLFIGKSLFAENNKINSFLYIPGAIKGNIYLDGQDHDPQIYNLFPDYISYDELYLLHRIEVDKKILEDNLKINYNSIPNASMEILSKLTKRRSNKI